MSRPIEYLWFLDTLVCVRVSHRDGADRISVLEGLQTFPDVVPDDLMASVDAELSLR